MAPEDPRFGKMSRSRLEACSPRGRCTLYIISVEERVWQGDVQTVLSSYWDNPGSREKLTLTQISHSGGCKVVVQC
jgi:hypothetical protein